jgi:hypothetical protein
MQDHAGREAIDLIPNDENEVGVTMTKMKLSLKIKARQLQSHDDIDILSHRDNHVDVCPAVNDDQHLNYSLPSLDVHQDDHHANGFEDDEQHITDLMDGQDEYEYDNTENEFAAPMYNLKPIYPVASSSIQLGQSPKTSRKTLAKSLVYDSFTKTEGIISRWYENARKEEYLSQPVACWLDCGYKVWQQ